jgi:hypothetical protein
MAPRNMIAVEQQQQVGTEVNNDNVFVDPIRQLETIEQGYVRHSIGFATTGQDQDHLVLVLVLQLAFGVQEHGAQFRQGTLCGGSGCWRKPPMICVLSSAALHTSPQIFARIQGMEQTVLEAGAY